MKKCEFLRLAYLITKNMLDKNKAHISGNSQLISDKMATFVPRDPLSVRTNKKGDIISSAIITM
jgi:hypothetical protein